MIRKRMLDYLTTLPVELIHKILDNVPSLDIFSSVCFVNKRPRSISLTYPRFQLNFSCMNTSMNKSQFDSICTQLLYSTSQVVSLILFDEDDLMTFTKNAFFFSRFSIIDRTFSNLRSLTLTSIKYDTWCLFKTRFPPLIVTFFIHLFYSGILSSLPTASAALSELLFLSPSLQRLTVKMDDFMDDNVKIHPPNSAMSSSVQYFYLDYVTIDLLSLLVVTPMLHTLEGSFQTPDLKLGRIYPRLLYLQQLRIELWAITWTEMVTLLSSFTRLVYLTVIADNVDSDMADGFAWAQFLQQIKYFEFKLEFCNNAFEQQPLNLDSFRTKFWLEDKKWFVKYDRSLDANLVFPSILYSNYSSIIEYPPHETLAPLVSESTTSEPTSFSHVHRLVINDQYLKYLLLHRYTHIKELYLSQVTTTISTAFKDLAICLKTSQIMTCIIGSEWSRTSSCETIEFLRSLPHLHQLKVSGINLSCFFLYQWPHIVHLKIENDFGSRFHVLCSNDIDALCYSFPRIKQLDIHSSSITDLPQLINRMKMTLTDILIRQPRNVSNEKSITHEWIKRNTELQNCHYTCNDWNSVRLWL